MFFDLHTSCIKFFGALFPRQWILSFWPYACTESGLLLWAVFDANLHVDAGTACDYTVSNTLSLAIADGRLSSCYL
jgi:hypothetical protein